MPLPRFGTSRTSRRDSHACASTRRGGGEPTSAAGLSVAAVALPTAIAYAQLAGFPPVVGLYASIAPLIVYAVFGTSRQLIVNPDAATCAMVAAIVGPLAAGDTGVYTALAVNLAVLTGSVCIVAGLFRLGFLADFLGKPVLVGFMNGIALSIVLGQIGKVFGFPVESNRILPTLFEFISKLPGTHVPTLIVGVATMVVLVGVRRFLPRLPAPLIALIVAVVLVQTFALDRSGVAILGTVPAGLPRLGWTPMPWDMLGPLMTGAGALALVSITSGMVTARSFAARNRYEIDVDREFIAIGACNVAAGLSQGFAVTGADSRTAVSDSMGGRTQVTGLVAAAAMALVLLFFTGPLAYLPGSALGAVLISAGIGLFDWRALVHFSRIGEGELAVCVTAMLGVVAFGAIQGIGLAVGLSILVLLFLSSRPSDAGARPSAGHAGLRQSGDSRRRCIAPRVAAVSIHRTSRLLQRGLLPAKSAGRHRRHILLLDSHPRRCAHRPSRQHRRRYNRRPRRPARRARRAAGTRGHPATRGADAGTERRSATSWSGRRISDAAGRRPFLREQAVGCCGFDGGEMKVLLAALVGLALVSQAPPSRPRILGLAHLAVFVSDLARAREFYQGLLGYQEPFTLPKTDGTVDIAFVKINDDQWIELFNRPSAGQGQLNHIALYTDDADGMRLYLASRGVSVPQTVGKGRTGNKNFMIKDADGHNVEIVEYQPDSWTAKDRGQHMPASRLSERALHAGILVGSLEAATAFYNGILGLEEFWRGSAANSPDPQLGEHAGAGRDGLSRVHAVSRPAGARGPWDRASHLPGRSRRRQSGCGARHPTGTGRLHPSSDGSHRHQPQTPGQPVRSRRHSCRADGGAHDRRQAGGFISAAAPPLRPGNSREHDGHRPTVFSLVLQVGLQSSVFGLGYGLRAADYRACGSILAGPQSVARSL